MLNTVTATIDLTALAGNLEVVRRLCPRSRIMALVKADAYGHGLLPVAKALTTADGLAVARLQEALALRKSGVTQRILLLGTLLDEVGLTMCSQSRIDVTAHDAHSLGLILSQVRRGPLRVWVKLDSGMHRIGFAPEQFVQACQTLSERAGVLEVIHMTHFSNAADLREDPGRSTGQRQMSCFVACQRRSPAAKTSLANSEALLSAPETHADWVRPGIMLYGSNPLGAASSLRLEPVMTLRARLIAIRDIGPGESVGYGGRWTSRRASRIGTVGIGYGDGYPRHAKNGTPVSINDCLAPLVGRVSMDSLTIDLTDCGSVSIGDEVILWGPRLPCDTIAAHAETIPYELLTGLTARVSREYVTLRRMLPTHVRT